MGERDPGRDPARRGIESAFVPLGRHHDRGHHRLGADRSGELPGRFRSQEQQGIPPARERGHRYGDFDRDVAAASDRSTHR